jgi:ubiquinone/menaquinone biosynthesis C-methylase UbiE
MPESISFDPVAHRYDATRFYPPAVAEQIASALIQLGNVSQRGSVLEIGIGTGRIALPLLEKGIDITGVDISPRMVERLRAKYDERGAAEAGRAWGTLTVEMADMTRLPFASGDFDAVVAVHVLHLVPEWRRALDEALRVIRPGGALLLGQDTSTNDTRHDIQDHWQEIMRDLGYTPTRVGASGYGDILVELRARRLPVEEAMVATWQIGLMPREALETIVKREWSLTWQVPDDLFVESARRLTAWAQSEYGDTLDTPQPATYSFKVARVPVGVA